MLLLGREGPLADPFFRVGGARQNATRLVDDGDDSVLARVGVAHEALQVVKPNPGHQHANGAPRSVANGAGELHGPPLLTAADHRFAHRHTRLRDGLDEIGPAGSVRVAPLREGTVRRPDILVVDRLQEERDL